MTNSSAPGGRGPRVNPLVIGLVSFALVFLLIVGATTAYLVVRVATHDTSGTDQSGAATSTASASASPSEKAEFCWMNGDQRRTSDNPSGKLRGGRLQFTPPEGYSLSAKVYVPFIDDSDGVGRAVENNWYALLGVGAVTWQPGYDYPGAKTASQRLFDCYANNSTTWSQTVSARHIEDQKTDTVTISGHTAYRTTGTVVFDKTTLTKTTGSQLTFIVLDTGKTASFFMSESSVGVPETVQGEKDAEASLELV